ncbi:MAG TPA: hypothetical protein VEN95_02105 [Actinomycetota bacterium]|jgi:hypothetical protein|nr:hypothetical protein [Actinomycetota bacterium]
MKHESMVHALEEIKRLLRRDACLIDIHPVREAPVIEVRTADEVLFAEPSASYDYDDDLKHAEDALVSAVERALFVFDGSHEFEFLTIAPSVVELRDFFAVSGAYEDPPDEATEARVQELYARVDEVMRAAGENARVAHRERARVARLNPVR